MTVVKNPEGNVNPKQPQPDKLQPRTTPQKSDSLFYESGLDRIKEIGHRALRAIMPYTLLAALMTAPMDSTTPEINVQDKNSSAIYYSDCRELARKREVDLTMERREKERVDSLARKDYELSTFDSRVNSQTIPVLMFHRFGEKRGNMQQDRYIVTPEEYSYMLEELHRRGYRTVSANEFTEGDFQRIRGHKPVLLTFDDADSTQFRYLQGYKDSIDTKCAVGIMKEFEKRHPSADLRGLFFISDIPFGQESMLGKKLEYLSNNHFEVGQHTADHIHLKDARVDDIKRQQFYLSSMFRAYSGEELKREGSLYFSYPYGEKPSNPKVVEYINSEYKNEFNAWGGRAHHPLSRNNDPHGIPRIETNMQTFQDIILGPNNDYTVLKTDAEIYAQKFHPKQAEIYAQARRHTN